MNKDQYDLITAHVYAALEDLTCAKMTFHGFPQDMNQAQSYALLSLLGNLQTTNEWLSAEAAKFAALPEYIAGDNL